MNREEILTAMERLSTSQGSWGRLLSSLKMLKVTNPGEYERGMRKLENRHFKDPIDMIMYYEC